MRRSHFKGAHGFKHKESVSLPLPSEMFIYNKIKHQFKLYEYQHTPEKAAYDVKKFPVNLLRFVIYSAAVAWVYQ